jgi:geranylgeranyl diphosphate synthase type I
MTTVRSLKSELNEAPAILENFLSSYFQQNVERYSYGELFEPLYLDLTEFVSRRGKRIRPMLFLMAYRLFGGDRELTDSSLLKSAVSLELLHAFILMHDDVIDQSERRRGLPTFHKLTEERMGKLEGRERVGQNVAMVMGDMLFALAVETLHSTDFPAGPRNVALSRFLRYVSDTGCGEIYDILMGKRDITRVSENDIVQMYNLKTTRYTFEAPIVLGGLLAGASPDLLNDIEQITDPLGLAFQIQNDLIEFSHFDLTDRAMQTDLLEGKKTLLMRMAFDRLNDLDRSFLQLCLSAPALNDSSIIKIRELIEKSGAVAALRERMQELFAQSERALEQAPFSVAQRDGLREAIAFIRQQTQYTGTN